MTERGPSVVVFKTTALGHYASPPEAPPERTGGASSPFFHLRAPTGRNGQVDTYVRAVVRLDGPPQAPVRRSSGRRRLRIRGEL